MAGTTTYYGISYPTATDYVKDGATAMQTIADGFDSAVAIPTYNNQTGTTYTFVLADAGKTVTSNNASAVTFTIPPQASVAWANNTTLTVRNLGAGVVTIAGGAGVTVTNTASTIAQYGSAKIVRTGSNAWTVLPDSGGASALTLLTTASFTSQTQINLQSVFSDTYTNYLLLINLDPVSGTSRYMNWQMLSGATPTSDLTYYWVYYGVRYGNVQSYSSSGAEVSALGVVYGANYPSNTYLNIFNPKLAKGTSATGGSTGHDGTNIQFNNFGWLHNNATAYDGIRMSFSVSTSGTYQLYGYGK